MGSLMCLILTHLMWLILTQLTWLIFVIDIKLGNAVNFKFSSSVNHLTMLNMLKFLHQHTIIFSLCFKLLNFRSL